MKRLVFAVALVACDPPAPTQNIDVRVEFEPTSDAYASYISAFLVIPAMGVHAQLFAVPFPYRCMPGTSDASDVLVVQCNGDDGSASASVSVDHGHVIAVAHDYGRITAEKAVQDLALPPSTTATVFTPLKFPEAH